MMIRTTIRPFGGSLAEAQGLLAVEKVVFDESPYTAEEVQAMLTDGPQRAWLALAGEEVVGFTIAFVAHSLHGSRWEIDLLAVHPRWQGRGLGRRLIRAAAAHGATLARRARALVADDNGASARAFAAVGFRRAAEADHLLVYRTDQQAPPPLADPAVRVWAVAEEPQRGWALLLAAQGDRPVGYVELLRVETLLYRGVWLESWRAETAAAGAALVRAALARAVDEGRQEVGAVVPDRDRAWQETLLDAGFGSLGRFYRLTARLPLPGLAA